MIGNDGKLFGKIAVEMAERAENKSLLDSRLVKGGAVAFVLGAVLGIGVVAEIGLLAAGGGAGWHWVNKKKEK